MNSIGTTRELAQRSNNGIEVTLLWDRVADNLTVCVCDKRQGAYFEIHPVAYLALDVYHHPYAYRDCSDVDYQDQRLTA